MTARFLLALLPLLLTLLTGVCARTAKEIYVKTGDLVALKCPCKGSNCVDAKPIWTSYTTKEMVLTKMSSAERMQMSMLIHGRSLVILNSSVKHQGNYSCSLGNASRQYWFSLMVYTTVQEETTYPWTCVAQEACELICPDANVPAKGVSPKEIYVKAGDLVALECPCKGSNCVDAKPIWTSYTTQEMDLTKMSSAERMQMGMLIHGRSLVILTASVNHQGNYSCSLGNASRQYWFSLMVYTTVQEETTYPWTCVAQEACELICPDANVPAKGHRQNITTYYYRAVEGEMFMMPCFKNENGVEEVVWSMTGEGREGNDRPCFHCQWKFLAEEKHSGKYTCLTRNLSFHLQVVKRSLECSQPKESSQLLFVGIGGGINCPGCICSNNTETNVTWYKGTTAVSTWNRSTCGKNGSLYFCKVDPRDTGLYFCDRQMIEQGIKLTVRRAVNVTVISCERRPPNITYPDVNKTEEVELGQSHTLTCEINFPFEAKFSPVVQWYMHYGGNIEDMTLLSMEKKE
ncbi:Interleukin-18 receptor accessory protein [Larimichthys crocea]|uniref:Uncharacterized protein n=1 Tax=Larimichthys crocea TaxID=215358 RepID=A0ACD3R1U8_LARCR|nr:Interleukin-18 receptor accessory protein [Larimichthys crocea]